MTSTFNRMHGSGVGRFDGVHTHDGVSHNQPPHDGVSHNQFLLFCFVFFSPLAINHDMISPSLAYKLKASKGDPYPLIWRRKKEKRERVRKEK